MAAPSLYGVKLPSGVFLKIRQGTQIQFSASSPIFTTANDTIIPGAYTFPFDVDATPGNLSALGYPDRPDNALPPATIAGVTVYLCGLPYFTGKLTVRRVAGRDIALDITSNPARGIPDTSIRKLPLGTFNWYTDEASIRAHMAYVAERPYDFPYVFFPIFNEQWRGDGGASGEEGKWQNPYNRDAAQFVLSPEAGITPFVKLHYILEALFAESGYAFSNAFQDTLELQLLYLYNLRDIREVIGSEVTHNTTFNLADHVPDLNGRDLVKSLMGVFGLGLFANPFLRTTTLKPLRSVFATPAKHHWSAYRAPSRELTYEASEVPTLFRHAPEPYTRALPAGATATEYDYVSDLFDIYLTLPDNSYHYVRSMERLFIKYTFNNGLVTFPNVSTVVKAPASEGFEGIDYVSPFEWLYPFEPYTVGAERLNYIDPFSQLPNSEHQGNYAYNDNGELKRTDTDTPAALLFYRGIHPMGGGLHPTWSVPYAQTGTYRPHINGPDAHVYTDGVDRGEVAYSLRWDGVKGLYNRWHYQFHRNLLMGKHVTDSFMLPINELINFNFDEKIRVDNMEYLAKSYQVRRAFSDGRVEVEFKLVTVI